MNTRAIERRARFLDPIDPRASLRDARRTSPSAPSAFVSSCDPVDVVASVSAREAIRIFTRPQRRFSASISPGAK